MTYVELRNAISEINIDVWHRVKSADDATEEIGDLIYSYTEARVREALEKAIDKVAFHGGSVEIEAAIRDLIPTE